MSFKLSKINIAYTLAFVLLIFAAVAYRSHTDAAAVPPKNTPPGSTLNQRIAQRKQERGTRLDKTNRLRIQSTCTGTQGVFRSLSDSYSSMTDNRDKVYGTIDAKLWIIVGSLKLVNKDTFKLEQQKLAYDKLVQKFDNQAGQFKQTVSDITAMNCQADPNGFMALIETSRLYNAQIRQSFKDIRNQVVNTLSPTITQHANDLKVGTVEQ
ncbi:MAG TPA: hypothetical protein VFW77_03835 [Candidatus Saccharimonadales bacterium]|nr:hypothetical protein [Candidatus Saccharimonadales bacterium]